MFTSDHVTFAACMGVAMALVKAAEQFFGWLRQKVAPQKQPTVLLTLSPEVHQLMTDTHAKVIEITPEVRNSEVRLGTRMEGIRDRVNDVAAMVQDIKE